VANEVSSIASPPISGSAEGTMLRADVVQEILGRLARGERIKRIARELGVDRKTIKRWRRRGGWRPQRRHRRRLLNPFRVFLERRGPEVGWNAAVLHRELGAPGYAGTYLPAQRYVRPLRSATRWAAVATSGRRSRSTRPRPSTRSSRDRPVSRGTRKPGGTRS
jgi:hypothetical protein